MSIKVENYLRNLEDEISTRRTFHDGSNMLFIKELKKREFFPGFSKNQIETTTLPSGLTLYLKRFYCEDEPSKDSITNEVVFSRIYNTLGVNAVKYYPLILNDHSDGESYGKDVAVASQSLNSVTGIHITPVSSQADFNRFITKYNFQVKRLLEKQNELYSTSKNIDEAKSLLANFIKTGFLDIICMMVDNHLGNKSVVKKDRKSTAEDIMSFDLEDSCINLFNNASYSEFEDELKHTEDIFSGVITIDGRDRTYIDYLNRMRELRDSENLPPECIELFSNILSLNFENLIANIEKETGLIIPTHKKDILKKLIDISQETLSR